MPRYMPSDLAGSEDLGSSRLPAKPRSRGEKWETVRNAAMSDPDNISKWDHLFRILDESWESGTSENDSLKSAVSSCYTAFLSRFPFSVHYWKQFSTLQFKLCGLEESLLCLQRAVNNCPQNVSLWVDYITGLQALKKEIGSKSTGTDEKKPRIDPTDEFLREEFLRGITSVGMNFNSDPFWDKYIEFENSVSETPSEHLLSLYKKLIRIPLYQYAQYYNQFIEVSKSFSVAEVISSEDIEKYLAPYGKSSPEELSTVEQHQVLDTFAYDVFSVTQRRVSEKWPFESTLTLQDYLHTDQHLIEAQYPEWGKYLDFEISALEVIKASGANIDDYYEGVMSLFERALVPNCTRTSLWLKYTKFIQDYSDTPSEEQKSVFERAIFKFVPVDESSIRDAYATVLLEAEQFQEATDFLLKTLKLFLGTSGSRLYVKTAYMHDLSLLLKNWQDKADASELAKVLESLATTYFERIDRYTKESKENGDEVEPQVLKKENVNSLQKYINNDGIALVVVKYLQALSSIKEVDKIRAYFNKYHTEQVFSHSVQFWKFFVDFEIQRKNLPNLKVVVDYIKTTTALPKKAVDAFLDIYYEYTCANLHAAVALSSKSNYLDILVKIGAEKSDDLIINEPARARVAANNYVVHDMRLHSPQAMEQQLMSMSAKHIAHPGIFVDNEPELTNSTMGREWVSLLDDEPQALPPPIFRNLEKANAPINYPDE